MVNRPDRLQVWAAQLAANDFPPICAMTGRPAETWRKFRFVTPPQWAYALLALVVLGGLGIIIYAIVVAAVAERASGHLPLTRSSRLIANLAFWVPPALLVLAIVLWIVAAIVASSSDPATSSTAGSLALIGILAFISGLIARYVATPLLAPRGKVYERMPYHYDKIVELRNLHPVFVAAAHQMYASRAAQHAAAYPPPGLPQMPGSN